MRTEKSNDITISEFNHIKHGYSLILMNIVMYMGKSNGIFIFGA